MRCRADTGSFSASISTSTVMSSDSIGASAAPGAIAYPVPNSSKSGMIERAAWKNAAVVEVARGPVPRELPPVAHAPRVVALTGAVDRDGLVADRERARHPRRDLVAGRHRVRERRPATRPLEIDRDRDRRARESVVARSSGTHRPDRRVARPRPTSCTVNRVNGSGQASCGCAASPSGHGSSWSITSTVGSSAPTSAIHHQALPRFGYSPSRT